MSSVPVAFANETIPCFDSALNQSLNFTSFTPLVLPVIQGNVPLDNLNTPVDLIFADVSGSTNVGVFNVQVGQTGTLISSFDASGNIPNELTLSGLPVRVLTDISNGSGLRLFDTFTPADFGTFAVGSSGTTLGWFDANANPYTVPISSYGQFISLSNQTVTGASTPTPLIFDAGSGVYTDISGGLPGTDLVVSNTGTYRIQTHVQLDHSGVGTQPAITYLTINGSQLGDSGAYQTIGAAAQTHLTDEHIVTITPNDVVNVVLFSTEATMTATTTAATVDYPDVPSVSVLLNRIA